MSYHSIEDPSRLRRILDAVLLLEKDLELPALLQHVIEEACSMTGARYGALGVLNDDKSALAEFITVGLSAEDEAQIGPRPREKVCWGCSSPILILSAWLVSGTILKVSVSQPTILR